MPLLVSATIYYSLKRYKLLSPEFYSIVLDFVRATCDHANKEVGQTFYMDVFNMISVALHVRHFSSSKTSCVVHIRLHVQD